MELHLCINCLQPKARPIPVGYPSGHQLDPTQKKIDLCTDCTKCLCDGDLPGFHERYTESRMVSRSKTTGAVPGRMSSTMDS